MLKNLCYHTHNFFCDGKSDMREMVLSAINHNVTHIGISSHAPLKFPNEWNMKLSEIENYRQQIEQLQHEFNDKISIYKSLEIDYIPQHTYPFSFFTQKLSLDYTIGSVHIVRNPDNEKLWFIDGDKKQCLQSLNDVFYGDIRNAVETYFKQIAEMAQTQRPDIIGHFDKIVMNTSELFDIESDWYREAVQNTLSIIAKSNSILEINTRGLYKQKWHDTFPSKSILKLANQLHIPIVISSDAHHSSEIIASYDFAYSTAIESGYSQEMMLVNHQWQPISIEKNIV
jgi:histidinol-phosphatase (PHP family)